MNPATFVTITLLLLVAPATSMAVQRAATTTRSPLSASTATLARVLGGDQRQARQLWNDFLLQGLDPYDHHDSSMYRTQFDSISSICRVQTRTVAKDGTVKLLLNLAVDELQIETVIIPTTSTTKTVCVSSQVGCRQACTFCATGKMGLRRNLSVDEILCQVFLALQQQQQLIVNESPPRPITNVVFMGMGETADNALAVVEAVHVLTKQFRLAPRRVTISTVGNALPEILTQLVAAPAVLAWSVHASRDHVRKRLVPSTGRSMVDIRETLVQALAQKKESRRQGGLMIEVTLLDGINDSKEDAIHLGHFCRPIPHALINLIPWNPVSSLLTEKRNYRPSTRVKQFQQTLRAMGILCFVRRTHGDDENAACGQLATMTAIPPTHRP